MKNEKNGGVIMILVCTNNYHEIFNQYDNTYYRMMHTTTTATTTTAAAAAASDIDNTYTKQNINNTNEIVSMSTMMLKFIETTMGLPIQSSKQSILLSIFAYGTFLVVIDIILGKNINKNFGTKTNKEEITNDKICSNSTTTFIHNNNNNSNNNNSSTTNDNNNPHYCCYSAVSWWEMININDNNDRRYDEMLYEPKRSCEWGIRSVT